MNLSDKYETYDDLVETMSAMNSMVEQIWTLVLWIKMLFCKISLFSENVCWINLNFLNKLDTDQPKRTNDSIAWNFQLWPIKFTSLQSFVALQIIFALDVKENFEYLATNCKTAVIWSWRRPSRIGLIKGQQEPCLSVKMPDWAQNVPDSLATVQMDRHQIHRHNCE